MLFFKSSQQNEFNICSPLNIIDLEKYVKLHHVDKYVDEIISENPSPVNNRTLLNSVITAGNLCPFREKVLQKMSRNETINVLVVGGSLTLGGGSLPNRLENRWSNKLDQYLNSGWYSGKFNVINLS